MLLKAGNFDLGRPGGLEEGTRHCFHPGRKTRDTPKSRVQAILNPVKQTRITRMMWVRPTSGREMGRLREADGTEVDIELIEKPIETENIEIRNTTART